MSTHAYRGAELYVKPSTKQRLKWIATALGTPEVNEHSLADQFLNEVIEARFPKIKEVEEQLARIQDDLAKVLQA